MNKYITLLIIAAVIICAAVLIYQKGWWHQTPTKQIVRTWNQTESLVNLTKSGFEPQVLYIKKGDQVTFINKDSAQHRITSDPYPRNDTLADLDSLEPLSTDESYTYTFDKVGTFTYHDELNPLSFKGTIFVQ